LRLALVAAALATLFAAATPLTAATFTDTGDSVTSDGVCTPRAALLARRGTLEPDCGTALSPRGGHTIAVSIPDAGAHTIRPITVRPPAIARHRGVQRHEIAGSPLDLARIATTLREHGAVEIDVPGALVLSGEWSLPKGTITIRARGGVVADGWNLVSPGSNLTLDGPGVRLHGRTHVNVAQPGGRGGRVALMGAQGIVEIGDSASIDASGAAGQGGHITLSANDVRARGALRAVGRGLIEVEARGNLQFLSRADTGGGLVRLDPTNMRIANFSGVNTDVLVAAGEVSPNNPPATGQLDANNLATLLASNSVVVHTTSAGGPGTGLQTAITGDTTDGDISVEAPVTWNSAFSLSLLAHDDLIIRAYVQNGGSGSVVGVSGWDGTTMSGFTGNAVPSGAYGAVGGDTFIVGSSNPTGDNGVAFGSRAGTTALWAYNLTLRGSTSVSGTTGVNNDGFAMAGFRLSDGSIASGAIQVTAHHDVSLVGGTTADDSDRFAQIGHGGVLRKVASTFYTPGNTQGNLSGPITVNAGGALLIDDGINYGYSQIGHGGLMFQGTRGDLSGDITVSAASLTIKADFFQSGRPSGYAQVGHGGSLHSGFGEQSIQGDIDGAITITTDSLSMTSGTRNSSAAQIGHGGSGDWSGTGTLGSQTGNIGSHVAGGAPIVVTVTNDVTLDHVLSAGRDGTSQIGHGGPIFYASTFGTILGDITLNAGGNVTLTGGADCPGSCSSHIGHSSLLESLFNVDVGAVQGDIIVTAGGTVSVTGGGATPGGEQYEWSQIGHGGPLLGFQAFNGGVADQHLTWAGAPAAGANTNDVTVTAASVVVQGGKGLSAFAQIGHGGLLFQFDTSGQMTEGALDGKVTVTATTGDLQVAAGVDFNVMPGYVGTAYAQVGNGGQNVSPSGVLNANPPKVTEAGASGAVTIVVAHETSLTDDVGGSMWWLGHRTIGTLTGAPVLLDTGTLDFVAGPGASNATISDPKFWNRFVADPAPTGPEKANAVGGSVTLRAHGLLGTNGNLISNQPLTIPAAISNPVHVLSTDDLTINSSVTNNGSSVIDLVADDANPGPPAFSPTALLTIDGSGAITGNARLFAVAGGQFAPGGYSPPNTAFGVWYGPPVCGSPVVGVNFKLAPVVVKVARDFDGDVRADILWRNDSGTLGIWRLDGTQVIDISGAGAAPLDWQIVGVGDFNGDGRADILWRHTSGTVAVWLMNGTQLIGAGTLGAASIDWQIAGVGDFNCDGRADILWRHTSGTVAVWLLNGTQLIGSGVPGTAPLDWQIAGVGDFNGDGRADILWRHTSGAVATWLLDGTAVIGSGAIGTATADWTIASVADFNGDGRADILWRHTSGTVATWSLNGTAVIGSGVIGAATPDWTIASAADFNGDGRADILWRDSAGTVAVWLLNGNSILATSVLGAPATSWHIQ
jgi:hypothetical protein